MSKELSLEERRARLERRANVIRSRLLRTIDELDVRRHQVTALAQHGKRLAVPAAIALAGGAVLAAGLVFGIKRLVARRRTFVDQARDAIGQLAQPKRPPIWEDALRKLVVTSVAIVASEVVKRGARNVLDSGHVPPLLAAPQSH